VTLSAGGLQGMLASLRTKMRPETDQGNWQDGQPIRVGGVVQALGAAGKTPFTGTDAVVVEFEMQAARQTPEETATKNRVAPPSVRGIDCVPFGIVTSHGFVAVRGTPWLKNFPPAVSWDQRYQAQALPLLMQRRWQVANFEAGKAAFAQYLNEAGTSVNANVVNNRAVRTLFAPEGQPTAGWLEGQAPPQLQGQPAAEAMAQRVATRRWQFWEYALQPGAEVTVEGKFLANPPRIEVGRWMLDGSAMDAIRPGLAAQTASRQWWQALGFTVFMMAVTGALHYVVYAEGGVRYRQMVEWFESLPS
jgi:hypothetical protein